MKLSKVLTTYEITFEHTEHAFKPCKFGEDEYQWVIALAQQSSSKYSKLSKVKLVEMRYSHIPTVVSEWLPTEEVRSAFEDAGMAIEKNVIQERPGLIRHRRELF